MRQPVRKVIGGSPTSSLKRRASAARDTPARVRPARPPSTDARGRGAAGAGPGRRPGRRRRGTSAGASASGRANHARSDGDQQQVEQAVEHGLLPGSSLTISSASSPTSGLSQASCAQHEQRRQRAQQPPADLAVELVGAGEHHGRPVGRVAPRAHAEVHHLRQLLAVGRRAALAGVDHGLRRGGRVVGDRVGLGAADDGDVAGARAAPARRRRAAIHASPRTTATSVSGASSSIRSDHGGSSIERSRNAPRARGPSSRPATASMREV